MDPELRPVVLFAARSLCRAPWRWVNADGHMRCANLWLIADGVGTWSAEGRDWPCSPGDFFVQRLWKACVGTTPPGRTMDVLWANIGWRDRQGRPIDLVAREAELPAVHRRLADLGFAASLFRRLIAAFEANDRPQADRWLACVLDEAAAGASDDDAQDPIARAIAAVRRQPERAWRVAGLARAAGLPVDAFTRRFRARAGVSARAFLVRARLDAAKAMLRMSSLPVGEIAERLGFCDIYHFSRRFRAHVGCAPSAYRAGRGG